MFSVKSNVALYTMHITVLLVPVKCESVRSNHLKNRFKLMIQFGIGFSWLVGKVNTRLSCKKRNKNMDYKISRKFMDGGQRRFRMCMTLFRQRKVRLTNYISRWGKMMHRWWENTVQNHRTRVQYAVIVK